MATEEPVNTSNDIPDKTHEITVGCGLRHSSLPTCAFPTKQGITSINSPAFMPPEPDALQLPMSVSTWKPKMEAIPIKPSGITG
ncbi:hypothetical protein MNBD_GAMMA19-1757 [hydrothermal vent metagenome]|uniref:Uncharacterized protein n=1 Tax=hydrothermal vent metagenome TaxID=652676 RepID=A0A3B1AMJ1_9ZZZZ